MVIDYIFMNIKKVFFTIIFLFYLNTKSKNYPDFNSAHVFFRNSSQNLDLFRDIYRKNNLNVLKPKTQAIIPLKIHQIWIGPKPLPEKFKWMIKSWQEKHPNWEYKLWTNEDLKYFKLINQEAFDKAQNWGAKSDIFRLEILKKFGGVYVDIDFECLKSLDILHHTYKFYCGVIIGDDVLANGIMGCISEHPIINEYISRIKISSNFSALNWHDGTDILKTTGPYMFTDVFLKYINIESNQERIIALPSSYFFPFPATSREEFWLNKVTRNEVEKYFKDESFGVHYWATSWQ